MLTADDLQKEQLNILPDLDQTIMRVVCASIFRIQGQGVFPLQVSIVPAATVILREQRSIQG